MAQHIIVSTTSPTSAPTALGQHYINTTTGTVYMSAGTASTADWKPSTQLSNEELQDILGPMFEGTSPITATYDDLNNKVVISLNQTLLDHTNLQNIGTNTHSQIDSHIADQNNPHNTTKSQVGLGNVDNTSDLNKPISNATQTALNSKENTINAGTITQYWRGDKSWQTLDKNAVGLGNVDNTSDLSKPISNLTQTALNGKEPSITSGVTTQYWRGDKSWQTLDKNAVGLGNVDNTSDLNKPISNATQTALNNKSDINHSHPDATTSTSGFMSPTDKVKLDGLSNDVIVRSTTAYNNTSSTVYVTAPQLQLTCVAGRIYHFKYLLRHTSVATTTGVRFGLGGTAVGTLTALANVPNSATPGTASNYHGPINAFNTNVATTASTGTTPSLAIIEGIFVCTSSGVLYPQFLSETGGSNVSILSDSILIFKEIV